MENNKFKSTWSEIEKRLNLQRISEFIRHGGDIPEIDTRNFAERLTAADENLHEYLETICRKDNTEDILENIAVYTNIHKDIYFVMGMKAGAQIITKLTGNIESDLI